jgi:hypothetical protein
VDERSTHPPEAE